MDVDEIRRRLLERGFNLLPSASADLVNTIAVSLYLHMDEFYEKIYLNFNGLYGDDDLVSLWPLEEISSEDVDVKPIGGKVYSAIGDVMIMFDIIIACLEDRNAPLMLLHEKRILASCFSTRSVFSRTMEKRFLLS